MKPEEVIRQLNDQGLMVSVDYYPDGTYSASVLRQEKVPTRWVCEWIEGNISDLAEALERGRLAIGPQRASTEQRS